MEKVVLLITSVVTFIAISAAPPVSVSTPAPNAPAAVDCVTPPPQNTTTNATSLKNDTKLSEKVLGECHHDYRDPKRSLDGTFGTGDNPMFTFQTFTTIAVTLMIIVSNCGILIIAAWTEAFANFNKIFIYSLTVADLLIGILVAPYSIYLSVYRRMLFNSEIFCSIEAYLLVILLAAKIFSLAWLNVDHYVAVRKPERYGVMMSATRSSCWVTFSWIIAVSFNVPPLFSPRTSVFNDHTFACQVYSKCQYAYLSTTMVLVTVPAVIAISITSGYLFTGSFHKRISFYEKVFFELSTRPRNYRNTSLLAVIFSVMWTPFLFINFFTQAGHFINAHVEFYAYWLGLSSCYSQFVAFTLLSPEFRDAVREMISLPSWCPLCGLVRSADDNLDVNIITLSKKK